MFALSPESPFYFARRNHLDFSWNVCVQNSGENEEEEEVEDIGRVLSSEISAEAHPRGVLSRVVSSGFSCRVLQASPNPYLFPIAQSVKAQFLADFWT